MVALVLLAGRMVRERLKGNGNRWREDRSKEKMVCKISDNALFDYWSDFARLLLGRFCQYCTSLFTRREHMFSKNLCLLT